MKLERFTLACVLALASLTSAARAQTPAAPAARTDEDAQKARAELERGALALLDDVGADAAGLKLASNRASVQVAVAELLWARDEKRARQLYSDATASLASAASALALDDPRYLARHSEMMPLRGEMTRSMAQHDPKIALEFLRATRLPIPVQPDGNGYYGNDPELALEAGIAELVSASDPKRALALARETLAKGLSGSLTSVLENVSQRDPEGASKLATEIARKLRTANLANDYEAANLASYLLARTTQPGATPGAGRTGTAAPLDAARLLTLDEQTRRDLLSAVVGAATATSGNARGQLIFALRPFATEIERSMPSQAQALRRSRAPFVSVQREGDGLSPENQSLMQTGTPEAILEAAVKVAPEWRSQMYRAAAWKAWNGGSAERARQIINDNVANPQQRAGLLRELDREIFWRTANGADAQQARDLLSKFTRPEDRMQMLIYLARARAHKGEKEAAGGLLEELLSQIGARAKSQEQLQAQFDAAQIYAGFDADRAFGIAEAAGRQLNEMIEAAAVVDGFGQESFEQDELKAQGGFGWLWLVRQCGGALAPLARTDFERAVAAADHFQRLEARLTARLAVARGVLAPEGDASAPPPNGMRRGRNR